MSEKAKDSERIRRRIGTKPNDNDKTFICFLDARKAFDLVNRDLLLIEMLKMELPIEVITVVAKILRTTSFDIGDGTRTFRGVQ